MLRGGPLQQDASKHQRQKKRLSFRDPEVEGSNHLGARKTSLEDLALEDRALNIAQNVGSAFSDLSITDNEQVDFSGPESIETLRETEIRDSSPTSIHRQLQCFGISAEDQDCLDSPHLSVTMRGPSVESPNSAHHREEVRLSSSAQHQVQLLRYQLEQQSQQTQAALQQAQLLRDRTDAECAARKKAQEQNNQLMLQNRELLSHMEKLFQQIEELERQILILEQEKKSQVMSHRQPSAYGMNRRASIEQVATTQNRCQSTTRKSSLTKAPSTSVQNSTPARKVPARPLAFQPAKSKVDAKERETLRIGDLTPPVQSASANPFSSTWKFNRVPSSDKPVADAVRSRTSSVKKQESTSLFGAGGTSKRYSSSTSDLYTLPRDKSSLMIEEPFSSTLNVSSTASKLPRYQPYRGRTSESEQQISAISKDSYKNASSLFNR